MALCCWPPRAVPGFTKVEWMKVVLCSPPPLLNWFRLVTVGETLKLIQNYPSKTSPLDFIPTALLPFVLQCGDVFVLLVCKPANVSFMEGIFPENFKIGQNIQLLNKPGADTKDPVNYWPITHLNTISKILERLANKQLQEHLPLSPNFNTSHSAYWLFHWTENTMTKVVKIFEQPSIVEFHQSFCHST